MPTAQNNPFLAAKMPKKTEISLQNSSDDDLLANAVNQSLENTSKKNEFGHEEEDSSNKVPPSFEHDMLDEESKMNAIAEMATMKDEEVTNPFTQIGAVIANEDVKEEDVSQEYLEETCKNMKKSKFTKARKIFVASVIIGTILAGLIIFTIFSIKQIPFETAIWWGK